MLSFFTLRSLLDSLQPVNSWWRTLKEICSAGRFSENGLIDRFMALGITKYVLMIEKFVFGQANKFAYRDLKARKRCWMEIHVSRLQTHHFGYSSPGNQTTWFLRKLAEETGWWKDQSRRNRNRPKHWKALEDMQIIQEAKTPGEGSKATTGLEATASTSDPDDESEIDVSGDYLESV
uniref:Uncharacterized protein n=1 Tax=Cannabis sativa TaxID=3483 RepID=A0A803PMV2_CANSA